MKTGTLKELNVNPGDVVVSLSHDSMGFPFGKYYTCVEGKDGFDSHAIGPVNEIGGCIPTLTSDLVFGIISRASEEPKLWRDMTDKCIVHGCQNHKHQGSFEGDLCAPCYRMLTTGNPKFGTTFVHNMEARILADAKVIEAADALAEAVEDRHFSASVSSQAHKDYLEREREALAAFNEALDSAANAAMKGEE